jgi:hypothetical protein
MNNPSERVLNANNQFEPFPERIAKRAIETEQKPAPEDKGEPDPNLPRKDEGKAKASAEEKKQKAAQKAADKKPKQTLEVTLANQPKGTEVDDVVLPRQDKAKALAESKAAKAIADIIPE